MNVIGNSLGKRFVARHRSISGFFDHISYIPPAGDIANVPFGPEMVKSILNNTRASRSQTWRVFEEPLKGTYLARFDCDINDVKNLVFFEKKYEQYQEEFNSLITELEFLAQTWREQRATDEQLSGILNEAFAKVFSRMDKSRWYIRDSSNPFDILASKMLKRLFSDCANVQNCAAEIAHDLVHVI